MGSQVVNRVKNILPSCSSRALSLSTPSRGVLLSAILIKCSPPLLSRDNWPRNWEQGVASWESRPSRCLMMMMLDNDDDDDDAQASKTRSTLASFYSDCRYLRGASSQRTTLNFNVILFEAFLICSLCFK